MNKALILSITKDLTQEQLAAHNSNYSNLADKDLEVFNAIDAKIQAALSGFRPGGKIPDGVYVGVVDNNPLCIYFPVAISVAEKYFASPKFFFKVAGNVSFGSGIMINLINYNCASMTFESFDVVMKKPNGANLTSLSAGVMYVLVPEVLYDELKITVREAADNDFISC